MKNSLIISLLYYVCVSCTNPASQPEEGKILSDTSHEAVTPLTAYDHQGQPYIWWIEKQKNSDKKIVVFATSNDMGNSFSTPVAISVTTGCNDGHGQGMPKLIFKKDGTMIVAYHVRQETEDNPYAGKIYYSLSSDIGKTWTSPAILHADTLANNSHGYPALTLLPDGEVAAIWLDGRNKLPHSELFMAQTEGKGGFVKEKKIGSPTCQCCKLDFYTDKANTIHVLYRGIMEDNIRDIMHIASSDSGKTFSEAGSISQDRWKIKGCPHAGPGMVSDKDSLHYVWFTMGGGEGIFYCRSDKNATFFSGRENLAKGISKYPQITSVDNTKLAITWQEYDTTSIKDKSYLRVKLYTRENNQVQNSYATPEGIEASHPAILALDKGNVLLTYEQKVKDKTVVAYRKIKL